MVTKGFSLRDLKEMYIDEMHEYYCELIYVMEKSGELKEEAYEKVRGIDKTEQNLMSLFNKAKK